MKFVCVGHSTYDTTLPMDEYPTENIKYRLEGHIECGGGPAANGAYLLAKWGMDTAIASVIGNDFYGDQIIKEYEKVGCDTSLLEKHEDHYTTSSYIIANRSNGSRTILSSKDKPIRKLNRELNIDCDVILIDGEHPDSAEELLRHNGKDKISVLDAGRLNTDTRHLGKMVKYLICSKDFAEEFSNTKLHANDLDGLIKCHKELSAYFNNQVIITLEDKGSFTFIDGGYEVIPSIKVKALDSTGAGDIFHGAFTYFISNGYTLRETIRYASITAAISVTRVGARYSIPELKEVLEYDEII